MVKSLICELKLNALSLKKGLVLLYYGIVRLDKDPIEILALEVFELNTQRESSLKLREEV